MGYPTRAGELCVVSKPHPVPINVGVAEVRRYGPMLAGGGLCYQLRNS